MAARIFNSLPGNKFVDSTEAFGGLAPVAQRKIKKFLVFPQAC
jgi:hypothetical protein